ncbi:MAG: carbohydrate kinase family protein [Candidatus Peribacteraceae bacterium]|nr:carbohydrate kinase family protein [Candidatus Peribacteraceae bacterium]
MTPSPRPHPRTLSVGGITFDLFVRTDGSHVRIDRENHALELPLGAKVRVDEIIEMCGGGASNTSVGFARLGCDAGFCGVVGSDQWGERLLENLQRQGVDTRSATVVEGENSSSSIILSVSSGERVILYNAGTNAHLHRTTFDHERAKRSEWIYLNHLQEDSIVIQDDLIGILEHTVRPIGFTWNPGGAQIEAGIASPDNHRLLAHTTVLLLNKEESLAFTGEETMEAALASCRKKGARIVCITDGENGVLAGDAAHLYRCPVLEEVPVIDTTGAGDGFGVGVSWAILHGLDLPNALRAGTINATSVLGSLGAQAGLLTDIEMQNRLRSVHLDVQAV